MSSVRIVDSLPHDKWMKFVDRHPDGNIFHTPFLMEVFKGTYKHRPTLSAAVNEHDGDILSLLLSVQVTLLRGPISRFTSRSIIYGGVLCENTVEGRNSLIPLMDVYNKSIGKRVILTEIRNMSPTCEFKEQLEKCGYHYYDYLNYLIDLKKPIDEIFRSFSKSRKKNIKKAEKAGIVIEEITNKGKLPILYNLIKHTYAKIKIPVPAISLFESAFDKLYPKHMIKMFLAGVGGHYIAGRAILLHRDSIFDWYAGADEGYLDIYPNETLVWHVLKWGSENGFGKFDFGGAGKPDEKYGVRDFKERFGGELVNYGRYMQTDSRGLLEISKKAYEIYRKLL